jgi:hypothetical protein
MPESDDPGGVAWDCPEDAHLTWTWNKQAFPEPLTPLELDAAVCAGRRFGD